MGKLLKKIFGGKSKHSKEKEQVKDANPATEAVTPAATPPKPKPEPHAPTPVTAEPVPPSPKAAPPASENHDHVQPQACDNVPQSDETLDTESDHSGSLTKNIPTEDIKAVGEPAAKSDEQPSQTTASEGVNKTDKPDENAQINEPTEAADKEPVVEAKDEEGAGDKVPDGGNKAESSVKEGSESPGKAKDAVETPKKKGKSWAEQRMAKMYADSAKPVEKTYVVSGNHFNADRKKFIEGLSGRQFLKEPSTSHIRDDAKVIGSLADRKKAIDQAMHHEDAPSSPTTTKEGGPTTPGREKAAAQRKKVEEMLRKDPKAFIDSKKGTSAPSTPSTPGRGASTRKKEVEEMLQKQLDPKAFLDSQGKSPARNELTPGKLGSKKEWVLQTLEKQNDPKAFLEERDSKRGSSASSADGEKEEVKQTLQIPVLESEGGEVKAVDSEKKEIEDVDETPVLAVAIEAANDESKEVAAAEADTSNQETSELPVGSDDKDGSANPETEAKAESPEETSETADDSNKTDGEVVEAPELESNDKGEIAKPEMDANKQLPEETSEPTVDRETPEVGYAEKEESVKPETDASKEGPDGEAVESSGVSAAVEKGDAPTTDEKDEGEVPSDMPKEEPITEQKCEPHDTEMAHEGEAANEPEMIEDEEEASILEDTPETPEEDKVSNETGVVAEIEEKSEDNREIGEEKVGQSETEVDVAAVTAGTHQDAAVASIEKDDGAQPDLEAPVQDSPDSSAEASLEVNTEMPTDKEPSNDREDADKPNEPIESKDTQNDVDSEPELAATTTVEEIAAAKTKTVEEATVATDDEMVPEPDQTEVKETEKNADDEEAVDTAQAPVEEPVDESVEGRQMVEETDAEIANATEEGTTCKPRKSPRSSPRSSPPPNMEDLAEC